MVDFLVTMSHMTLTTEDYELLLHLQEHGSITAVAEVMSLDKAFISRKVAKIAEKAPVLEKVGGKWVLTGKGDEVLRSFVEWKSKQQRIFEDERGLILVTTQAISERVVIPLLSRKTKENKVSLTTIFAGQGSAHDLLLSRKADLALVCGIPSVPDFRYKKVSHYPFYAVSSDMKHASFERDRLLKEPYGTHSGSNLRELLKIESPLQAPTLVCDHISGMREAVLSGIGWSVLPSYAVDREIQKGELHILKQLPVDFSEQFYLWWIANRLSKSVIDQVMKGI